MIKTIGIALAMAGLMSISVQAAPIVGSIGFTGAYSQNGGTIGQLNTATSMSIIGVGVDPFSTFGDFVGAGAPLSFASPIAVNGGVGGNVGLQLWSVTVGLLTYTFDITTAVQPFTSNNQLALEGNGTIKRNGLDATAGEWQLTFGRTGAAFTWQSTAASATPDAGSSLVLLCGAVVGMIGFARKALA